MGETYLRRYTDLPALLYLLEERKITLLDPQSWDDSNDSYYLMLYRERKNLKSVLALCFTQASETYHHWRVFANGSSGVCIRFKHPQLLKAVGKHAGLVSRPVRYLTLKQIRYRKPDIQELPFLKRHQFENEKEFRMIYESEAESTPTLDIDIPLACIDRVVLSPWINKALSGHVKQVLKSLYHCSGLEVTRSTLIGNEEWKKLGDSATEIAAHRVRKSNGAG